MTHIMKASILTVFVLLHGFRKKCNIISRIIRIVKFISYIKQSTHIIVSVLCIKN